MVPAMQAHVILRMPIPQEVDGWTRVASIPQHAAGFSWEQASQVTHSDDACPSPTSMQYLGHEVS